MNVQLNTVSDSRRNLVVTLDPGEVDTEHKAVVGEYVRLARLPGLAWPLDPQRRPAGFPVPGRDGRALPGGGLGHAVRRRMSKRFQVSTSRSHGTRTTGRHQRG